MQLGDQGQSSNIEDRRGMSGRGIALGGGGIGTLLLVLVLWLCGADPSTLLNLLTGGGSDQTYQTQTADSRIRRMMTRTNVSFLRF